MIMVLSVPGRPLDNLPQQRSLIAKPVFKAPQTHTNLVKTEPI
jgi:hypothetical protein